MTRTSDGSDMVGCPQNCCEHGDHAAPEGKRFCSPGCEYCEHMSVGDTGCDGFCVGGSCETPHNETAGFIAALMHDIELAKAGKP